MTKAARKKPAAPKELELGLGDNPLAGDDVLTNTFYVQPKKAPAKTVKTRGRQPLKDGRTFRLVTFSFYEDDVARLDKLLAEARKLGHRRVSRSQIVRLALRQVDLSQLPDEI
ncbi:MAG: hypothetical protein Q8O67_03860 [Deltaproteobacteria bacterium]|nr:hypothetical protein [Deltaproteobacteria bacterium]